MNLQPSEFITYNSPQRIATYNMVPGTVVRLRNHIFVLCRRLKGGPNQWIHARMRGDTTNLPVILFDPLDTDTDTSTDKENNNDNDNAND